MSSESVQRRSWRRFLAGFGAAALAAGLIATAPATSAEAAPTQTITGKLVFSASKSLDLSKSGYVTVYTSGCKWVTSDAKLKGNTYRVTVPKAGRYRVVYSGYRQTSKSPYGMQSSICEKSSSVAVNTGKTVRRDLTVTANGRLHVSGVRLKGTEIITAYSGSTPVMYFTNGAYGADLLAGTYRLAVTKWDSKRQRPVIVKVFGTRSKTLSKGKTVKLGSARALTVNFDRGRTASIKTFSYAATVKIGGTAKVGQVLSANRYKFPSGTKFTYRWARYGSVGKDGTIAGATGSKYRLTADDAGGSIVVTVTAKRSGYAPRLYSGHRSMSALRLTQVADPVVEGAELVEGADGFVGTVGTEIRVTPAKYAQGSTTTTYQWYDANWNSVSTSSSYTPQESDGGLPVTLYVTHFKRGYGHISYEFTFQITPWEPELEEDQLFERLSSTTLNGVVDGEAVAGQELSATPATFVQDGVQVSFVWTDDAGNILSENATFTPSEEHVGQTITLTAEYSKPGYVSEGEPHDFTVIAAG